MAVPDKIYPLIVEPGIQVDGTNFSSINWNDGEWVRFYAGSPKKMGGYKVISNQLPNICRGILVVPKFPEFRVFIGDRSSVYFLDIDEDGVAVPGFTERLAVADEPDTLWDFDVIYSASASDNLLIANGPPNLAAIDSNVETPVYYGNITSGDPLTPTGISVSGGVVALGTFLFYFGNYGRIGWAQGDDPTAEVGQAFVTANKIVYGLPVRGGQNSPAGLFWSLDCLIKCTHAGSDDPNEFIFDSITCESSVLSSQGIIEYDSVYYWAGVDRFLFYNGIVRELPNDMCLNFFFDNIKMENRQKVWVTKVTRWGEIWWFFPYGDSTECNAAIIYNLRLNKWYPSTTDPINGPIYRGDGEYEQTFAYPVWSGNSINSVLKYDLWMHEIGVDSVDIDGVETAIPSYITSSDISWLVDSPDRRIQNIDRWVYLYRVELDLEQTGDMALQVIKGEYARSEKVIESYGFSPSTEKIDMRQQGRQVNLRFVSNTIGGDYYFGKILMVARIGDANQ